MSDVTRTAGSPLAFPYVIRDAQNNLLTPAANPLQSIHASAADAATGANPLAGPTALTGAAGSYTGTFPAGLAAGTYYLRTVCSLLTDVDDRMILVAVSGSVSSGLVSLSDVKLQLRLPAGASPEDVLLQINIDAATDVIERIKGPCVPRLFTAEQHDGGGPYVSLDRRPVISVSSVTEYVGNVAYPLAIVTTPSAATEFSVQLDPESGVLTRLTSSGERFGFPDGPGAVQVTYTAGRAVIPPSVRKAAMHLCEWWWQSTQQGGRPAFNGGAAGGNGRSPMPSYAVPNFVYHLLEAGDGVRIPGIA
jgi:hypothetical protein